MGYYGVHDFVFAVCSYLKGEFQMKRLLNMFPSFCSTFIYTF